MKIISLSILFAILLFPACNRGKKTAVDKDGQAIIYYENIDIKNKSAKDVFIKGLEKVELSKYSEARDYFIKADKLESNNPVILNALGNTEAALNNFELSVGYFQKAKKLDSTYTQTYINYARLMNQMKKFDEAEAELKRTPNFVNLDSNIYAAWHFNLANAYFGQQKCVESLRQIEEAGGWVNNSALLRELKNFKQKVLRECKEESEVEKETNDER